MRSLANLLTEHALVALVALAAVVAAPQVAFADDAAPEAVETQENDPNDVTPPASTPEVRGGGCTSVCLSSGEDPYRCEEDCVFVTDEKSTTPACEG